ncbi:unnamed protein product [Ectocarpus sp. 4 AP-2014]
MTTVSSGRALFFCAAATLVAAAGAFHAPTASFNARSTSATGTAPSRPSTTTAAAASAAAPSASQQRRRGGATTWRRSGVSGLNARAGSGGEDEFYTPADLAAYSKPWGITLHYRGTLNTYRIEAHRPNGEVAGYTTGFYLGDLLHLDKVQIQRKESAYEAGAPNAPAPGTRDLPWAEKTGNLFQLGAVLGCAAVRYGWDRGARRVELLAIRENDKQHSRLVRYYRIAGFKAERNVGEDLGSLRDRLTWGAEGTLMVASADDFMRRWTSLMQETNASDEGSEAAAAAAAVEKLKT